MVRLSGFIAVVGTVLLGGCGGNAGVGEPCDDQRDCASGLVCSPLGRCENPASDAAATDMTVPSSDSGGSDAANTDASGTDASGTDASGTDAGGTDAASDSGISDSSLASDASCVTPTVDPLDMYFGRFEGIGFDNSCLTTADCVVGGCSGEVCAAESVITTCEGLPYGPTGSCLCVAGDCQWAIDMCP